MKQQQQSTEPNNPSSDLMLIDTIPLLSCKFTFEQITLNTGFTTQPYIINIALQSFSFKTKLSPNNNKTQNQNILITLTSELKNIKTIIDINDKIWDPLNEALDWLENWINRFPTNKITLIENERASSMDSKSAFIIEKSNSIPIKQLNRMDMMMKSTEDLFQEIVENMSEDESEEENNDDNNNNSYVANATKLGRDDSVQSENISLRDCRKSDVILTSVSDRWSWDVDFKLSEGIDVDLKDGPNSLLDISIVDLNCKSKFENEDENKIDNEITLSQLYVAIRQQNAKFVLIEKMKCNLNIGQEYISSDMDLSGHLEIEDVILNVNKNDCDLIYDISDKLLSCVLPLAMIVPNDQSSNQMVKNQQQQNGYKSKIEVVSFKSEIKNVTLNYNSILNPLEEFKTKDNIKYSLVLSSTGIEVHMNLHESHLIYVSLNDVKIDIFSDFNEKTCISLLSIKSLNVELEPYKLIIKSHVNDGKVKCDIDICFIGFGMATDALDLSNKYQKLNYKIKKWITMPQAPATTKQLKRQHNDIRKSFIMSPELDLTFMTFEGHIKLGTIDELSLNLTEAKIKVKDTKPYIHVMHLNVYMNCAQLLECTDVQLNIEGPCYLHDFELGVQQRSRQLSGENIVAVNLDNESIDKETTFADSLTSTTSLSEKANVPIERKSKEWQMRMNACKEMGIEKYFIDESEEIGSLLDFLIIKIEMESVSVTLPHDQNPGRLIAYSELWVNCTTKVLN